MVTGSELSMKVGKYGRILIYCENKYMLLATEDLMKEFLLTNKIILISDKAVLSCLYSHDDCLIFLTTGISVASWSKYVSSILHILEFDKENIKSHFNICIFSPFSTMVTTCRYLRKNAINSSSKLQSITFNIHPEPTSLKRLKYEILDLMKNKQEFTPIQRRKKHRIDSVLRKREIYTRLLKGELTLASCEAQYGISIKNIYTNRLKFIRDVMSVKNVNIAKALLSGCDQIEFGFTT